MKEYKTITKGWYGRIAIRLGVKARNAVVQHVYGDVIEVEGILFFVFRTGVSRKRWGYVHFFTGRGISDSYGFTTRGNAIEDIVEYLSFVWSDDGKTVREMIVDFEKNPPPWHLQEDVPWIINYLSPRKEPRDGLYPLLRTNINWEWLHSCYWECKRCSTLSRKGFVPGPGGRPYCPYCGQTFYGVKL